MGTCRYHAWCESDFVEDVVELLVPDISGLFESVKRANEPTGSSRSVVVAWGLCHEDDFVEVAV